MLCLNTHLLAKNLVCEAALCLIQDETIKNVNVSEIHWRYLVVSWCCESPNDVTFRLFCVSHSHKVQVFIQPLKILISANECYISVGLSVPTNSLTNFDLIMQ